MDWRDHQPRRESISDAIGQPALAAAVTVLLTACMVAMLMLQLAEYGPDVGAIVVFRPSTPVPDLWSINASIDDRVSPMTAGNAASRTCTLNPSAMTAGGGSLVVEARRMSRPPIYHVHWAGPRTSNDSANCGSRAELVLSRTDLQKLANTAGGYGAGPKVMGP